MTNTTPIAAPKIHPTTREILPDDPMEMTGVQVSGDPDLMLRLVVEEYARIGWGVAAIMQLARDPNYQAFHGLLRFFGEQELHRRVAEVISRCGVIRVKTRETAPLSDRLVQLEIPTS
jgi:hypothetical protein